MRVAKTLRALEAVVVIGIALTSSRAVAAFPFAAAKDGVIFGANVRAPHGVLRLGDALYFTDADLGVCRAVPIQEPIAAPADAVLTVDPASCVEVTVSGSGASFRSSDPTTNPPTLYDLVLAPHRTPALGVAAGVARLAHAEASGLQTLDSVAAPVESGTQLLPSAVAYDELSGYAYVGYSNSDRIDRFFPDPLLIAPTVETCIRTSDGSPTRALAFVGTNLFVAQVGGTGDGALAVAENLAATSCPLVPEPITAAVTLGHPNFAAVSGIAAGPTGDGSSAWLFVAESVEGAAVIHRLKITDGSALPDLLYVPEVYSHTGRFVDLQTTDDYVGDVALSYLRPSGASGPGVLFVSDDPDPTTTQPGGAIWSMSDMLAPTIDSPATGSAVTEVSIIGTWPGNDPYAPLGTVALLYDEQGYVVASGNVDGTFTLAYPDAVQGERRFVVRTADAVGEPTFNVSPPSAVLTLFVGGVAPGGDVTPPAPPAFTTPQPGAILRARSVTFSGTAEAGSTLVLTVDGQLAASLSVGAAGSWSTGTTLAAGSHTASAVARDAAGNVSAEATVAFTVELEPVSTSKAGGGGGCSTGLGGGGASLLLAAAALARRRRC